MRIRSLALALAFAWLALPVLAANYQVDLAHSHTGFNVSRLGVIDVYGRFNELEGTIVYDETDLAKSSVQVSIKTASLDTNNERRDTHLKSPDFFNAVQFPVIEFKSTAVKRRADGVLEVTGDLSLHGVTKSLTLEVAHSKITKNPTGAGDIIGFKSQLQLKRSDYGMTYMVGPLADEVNVVLAVQGMSQ